MTPARLKEFRDELSWALRNCQGSSKSRDMSCPGCCFITDEYKQLLDEIELLQQENEEKESLLIDEDHEIAALRELIDEAIDIINYLESTPYYEQDPENDRNGYKWVVKAKEIVND